MTVLIKSGSAGAGHGVTRFTDILSGTDEPFAIGQLWAVFQNVVNPPTGTAFSGTDVAAAINRGVTGLGYRNATAAGFLPVMTGAPIPVDWSYCRTKSQYSQIRFVSFTGGINRIGAATFISPNERQAYQLNLVTEKAQFSVSRTNGGTETLVIAESATTAYVAGDDIRLETDIDTTPGTTIVRCYRNGVLKGTFNDNTASRLTFGMFGLSFGGANPAVNAVISNFDGGIL